MTVAVAVWLLDPGVLVGLSFVAIVVAFLMVAFLVGHQSHEGKRR